MTRARLLRMKSDQRGLFAFATVVAAGYVCLRAIRVPMVHDECASLLWFVRSGDWIPYRAHWDANNHFISSGIGILSTRIFGTSLLAIRACSALAFVPYAWSAWRIGARVNDDFIRGCLRMTLLLCPFVLDFFSLFRGYAIAQAGCLVALDGLLGFAVTRSTGHLVITLLGMILANAAIVALVPVWAVLLLVLTVLLFDRSWKIGLARRSCLLGLLVVLGIVPLVYGASVAMELKRLGLLYHGSTDGFFSVTVVSLCRYVVGGPALPVGVLVVLMVILSACLAIRQGFRSDLLSPLVLINVQLWSDVVLRIIMARGIGLNYPEDRAALHLVPLALISIALAIDRLAQRRPGWRWWSTCLLILPLRTAVTANLDHTLLWPEQSVPTRFIERVAALQASSKRPLIVGGYHQLALAWPLNASSHGLHALSLQTEGFPDGEHDLRIADARTIEKAGLGYHVIDHAEGPGLWLLARERPLDIGPATPMQAPPQAGEDEFLELVHVPDTLLRVPSVVTVQMPFTMAKPSADVRLVVEVNGAEGTKLYYDAVAPLALRPVWKEDGLVMSRSLPALPTANRVVVYLYNPERTMISHGEVRITMSAIRQ